MAQTARLTLAIAVFLMLSACESRLNPVNWFGSAREETVEVVERAEVADPRPLVGEVTELLVERMPGGAIIRARGLPPTQGYWEAELVEVGRADGALRYEFRAYRPPQAARQGPPRSRELIVATYLGDAALRGVRRIVVVGQANRRSVAR